MVCSSPSAGWCAPAHPASAPALPQPSAHVASCPRAPVWLHPAQAAQCLRLYDGCHRIHSASQDVCTNILQPGEDRAHFAFEFMRYDLSLTCAAFRARRSPKPTAGTGHKPWLSCSPPAQGAGCIRPMQPWSVSCLLGSMPLQEKLTRACKPVRRLALAINCRYQLPKGFCNCTDITAPTQPPSAWLS